MASVTVPGVVAAGVAVAETFDPAIALFNPLISLIMTAIVNHYNTTGSWPTAVQVPLTEAADYQSLIGLWANYAASKVPAPTTIPPQVA
jgi:hypothetical protein